MRQSIDYLKKSAPAGQGEDAQSGRHAALTGSRPGQPGGRPFPSRRARSARPAPATKYGGPSESLAAVRCKSLDLLAAPVGTLDAALVTYAVDAVISEGDWSSKSMTTTIQRRKSPGARSGLHGLVFAVAMLSIALNGANTYAARQSPPGMHVANALRTFDDVWQYAAVFNLRPPRRLLSRHLVEGVCACQHTRVRALDLVRRLQPVNRRSCTAIHRGCFGSIYGSRTARYAKTLR